MNILIVDDHPLFRHALIQAVRYSLPQAQIHETAAVNEFYERLENGPEPDLVLLDVVMPGKNGFQLARSISRDPLYAQIPIIMCSSKGQETDRMWGLRQGAKDYITKPVNPDELILKIRAQG